MRLRSVALVVVTALLGVACGSAGGGASSDVDPGDRPVGAPVTLPTVEVVDVTADRPVELSTLLPADRPLLLWFWAPH